MKDYKYKVSVVITTYNSDLRKTLMTINSALVQKGVSIQIVIADDGSENNYFDEIEAYMEKHQFYDYVLVENKKNQGTVRNYISGIDKSEGEYVSGLGPGDLFYSENILKQWVEDMEHKETDISFSRLVLYRIDSHGKYVAVKQRTRPYYLKVYRKNRYKKIRRNYLYYHDLCYGPATFVKTDILKKYLDFIVDKIYYAEDNIFSLMIYNEEKLSFFDCNTVLYEFGEGVSTNNNPKWEDRLMRDRNSMWDILKSWCGDNKFDRTLVKIINTKRKAKKFPKFQLCFYYPPYLLYLIKFRVFVYWTDTLMPEDYMNRLDSMYEQVYTPHKKSRC